MTKRIRPSFLRVSAVVVAFGTGAYVAYADVFPWNLIRQGYKTAMLIRYARAIQLPISDIWHITEMPADSVASSRIKLASGESLSDPVVMDGGRWRFGELCPQADGCLAVEFSGSGEAGRTWPLQSLEIAESKIIARLPYEKTPGVSSHEVLVSSYVVPFSDGGLLATLNYRHFHFPFSAGLVRFDRTGRLMWRRRDYSHHEAYVTPGDTIWVPSLELSRDAPAVFGACEQGSAIFDAVNILDGDGALVDQVSVMDALLDSPWTSLLAWANPCDPLHMNAVSSVGDVSGLDGVKAGDMLLSLRELNAVAILDREAREVKRMILGTFSAQHSVKHLGGSRFIMFDNQGGGGCGRPADPEGTCRKYSRVLVVDAATSEETVIFPRGEDRFAHWGSRLQGRISISPDRTRVIASFANIGKAVEVRVEDGAVLAEFDFVHDVRGIERFRAEGDVIRFEDGSVFYACEWLPLREPGWCATDL